MRYMFPSSAYQSISFIRLLPFALLLAAVSTFGFSSSTTNAQTLDEIRNRDKVVVGIIDGFPPFGFLDESQELVGFNVDFANLMAEALDVELELVPVKSANRIPFLVTEKIDVLIASLGITPERAREVMFTIPIAADQAFIVAPEDVKISQLSDVSGLRVAVGRGSSNDIFFTEVAPSDTTIMRYDGEPAAVQALLSGQADALVLSNTMLGDLWRRGGGAKQKLAPKIPLKAQYDSIALRKDAFELHQWLNTYIHYLKTTGELDTLYRKWLQTQLPELPAF